MTNKNESQYSLITKDDRQLVRMQNGEPFVYSSKSLAYMGKRALEKDREIQLQVVLA